jgi:hypothetical protein
MINRIKFAIGLLFCIISLLGCFPLLNDVISGNVSSTQSTGEWMNKANKPVTTYSKNLLDTNYPIMLGCFALAGSLLFCSIKNKE